MTPIPEVPVSNSPNQTWVPPGRPVAEVEKARCLVAAWVARQIGVPVADVDVEVVREQYGTRVSGSWTPR